MGIVIHGDAALGGQGINYETVQMTGLRNYKTGGILHVVSNNQIGFTTTPIDGRSTPFCTDLAKSFECPIVHVNADDPISVNFVFKMAAEYMKKYNKDMFVDIIGYRRYGHNELDQPMFTQPEMYSHIHKTRDVLSKYEEQLISEGIEKEELDKIKEFIQNKLLEYHEIALNSKNIEREYKKDHWKNYSSDIFSPSPWTGLKIDKLREIGEKINYIPKDFNAHPMIKKIYDNRLKSIKDGKGIDWGTAEALAWGILLSEGITVRISGQDVQRGTFSHRHAVLHDQSNFNTYIPLMNVATESENFQPCLSHLSEMAVLAFELGFSYYTPNALVMWEAQFGDFANNAQTIIDQFISSGEVKWNVQTGLTLLLPHGMDGQGPEHSSARLERFLQLMDDDIRNPDNFLWKIDRPMFLQTANMYICNPTLPSNYFHLLLRQLRCGFRKPLIVMSPKKLLRYKFAVSDLSEFDEGTKFLRLRLDKSQAIIDNPDKVRKVLVCSGQVYYDLILEREKRNVQDIAIYALEQIAPLPYIVMHKNFEKFKNAKFIWVQEEHMNAGAWSYVKPRFDAVRFKLI